MADIAAQFKKYVPEIVVTALLVLPLADLFSHSPMTAQDMVRIRAEIGRVAQGRVDFNLAHFNTLESSVRWAYEDLAHMAKDSDAELRIKHRIRCDKLANDISNVGYDFDYRRKTLDKLKSRLVQIR